MNQFFKILTLSTFVTLFGASLYAAPLLEEDKKDEEKKETKKKNGYDKFLKDDVVTDEGLFTIYSLDNKWYFEINDSLMGRDMLLGSRIAEVSSTTKVVAGEMRKAPVLIRFSHDDNNLYLHQVVSDYFADEDDAVNIAVKRNTRLPIYKTFKIDAFNTDSTAVVIDVTKFFSEEIKAVSPFNAKYKAGKLEKESTFILSGQSFPENVVLKTQMSYSNTSTAPFLAVMARTILLLPNEPMKPRISDGRIGYFANSSLYFTSDKIGAQSESYISRFNIAPKPEDVEKYKAGEMVEPAKHIVFYVDNAFPEEWRKYIKAGVEDWQEAFEAIGF